MSNGKYFPRTSRDWHFGEIPIDWSITTLKYSCYLSSIYGANISADKYVQDGVRFIRTTDISEFGKLSGEGVYIDEDDAEGYLLETNDFLISRSGTVGRVFVYDQSYGLCAYAGYLVRYLLKNSCSSQYLYYLTKSTSFSDWLSSVSIESTIGNVNGEKYANFCFPIPRLQVQHAIIAFLDRETTRIDTLITEKERMLTLLQEKRTALISQAVTRGLDPNVPLKPSGLDWLGDIPAHWSIRRLKYLTSEPLSYGANESALDDNRNWPRFVRITDIDENGSLREETFKSLYPEIAEPYLLESGDVLFARSGTVGKSFIYKSDWGTACFAGYLIRFRSDLKLATPDYIYYFSSSDTYWQQIKVGMIQVTIQNFNAEKYGDLIICLPPLDEQISIVKHIKDMIRQESTLQLDIEKSIELLKERRSALITAAVTGQINPEDMIT